MHDGVMYACSKPSFVGFHWPLQLSLCIPVLASASNCKWRWRESKEDINCSCWRCAQCSSNNHADQHLQFTKFSSASSQFDSRSPHRFSTGSYWSYNLPFLRHRLPKGRKHVTFVNVLQTLLCESIPKVKQKMHENNFLSHGISHMNFNIGIKTLKYFKVILKHWKVCTVRNV
jgi:hypothetical protein